MAEDTGGAIKGNKIDVYYASHGKAMAHGVKYQKIRVYIVAKEKSKACKSAACFAFYFCEN